MAKITLFWCFEKKNLNRMMEFQVKFCHHSGLRLWRIGMFFSTKSKCHKSNVRISWMYRYSFYDLKVHFWRPNMRLVLLRLSSNTLYMDVLYLIYHILYFIDPTYLIHALRGAPGQAKTTTTWQLLALSLLVSLLKTYICTSQCGQRNFMFAPQFSFFYGLQLLYKIMRPIS